MAVKGAVDLTIDAKSVELATKRANDLRPALNEIGVYLLSETLNTFKKQSFDGKAWPTRMIPNIAGIVSDLNKGQQPKKRRFDGRPALVDTGRLRQSFTFKVAKNTVSVGTALGYASIHQRGGKSKITLTKRGRGGLVAYLRKNRDLSKDLGWLFRKPSFTVNARKRPMVGITKNDVKEILEIVQDHMLGE